MGFKSSCRQRSNLSVQDKHSTSSLRSQFEDSSLRARVWEVWQRLSLVRTAFVFAIIRLSATLRQADNSREDLQPSHLQDNPGRSAGNTLQRPHTHTHTLLTEFPSPLRRATQLSRTQLPSFSSLSQSLICVLVAADAEQMQPLVFPLLVSGRAQSPCHVEGLLSGFCWLS